MDEVGVFIPFILWGLWRGVGGWVHVGRRGQEGEGGVVVSRVLDEWVEDLSVITTTLCYLSKTINPH